MQIVRIQSSVPHDSGIYLVISDRTMLVDAGTGADPSVPDRIRAELGGRGLDMVVATHCHFDHIGGMPDIVREFRCPVYAGEADAQHMRVSDDRYTLASMFGGSLPEMEVSDLADGQVIDLGEAAFRVIHTPGHTRGSICLHEPVSGALISGDTLFEMGVGRTDFPGGSMADMRSSLRVLSNVDIRELYPGHGSICRDCGPELTRRALAVVGV